MYEVQNPDVPEGTVVDVMQAGYVIGDRCLQAGSRGRRQRRRQSGRGRERTASGPPKPANDDFPVAELLVAGRPARTPAARPSPASSPAAT